MVHVLFSGKENFRLIPKTLTQKKKKQQTIQLTAAVYRNTDRNVKLTLTPTRINSVCHAQEEFWEQAWDDASEASGIAG